MKKILLAFFLLSSFSGMLYAEGTASSGIVLVTELNKLIRTYEWQLWMLQRENDVLRKEMSKAGITIPLSEFSWSVLIATPTTITGSTEVTTSTWESPAPIVATPVRSISWEFEIALSTIEKDKWARYAGFIRRITPDWKAIRNAYKLPETAEVAGYEFVKKWNDDHAFVDISFDGAASTWGIYDAKILYQYDTKSFARKLIGLFIYDKKLKYYTTKTGNNPFGWVPREFISHPKIDGLTDGISGTVSRKTSSGSNIGNVSTVTLSDIEKAYTDKRYLSVISLSNAYLTSNSANYDLLRIRYRTYFIIGKYGDSLGEIEKIKALWRLDKSVACDAQVIATYGKNTALVNTYTSICKGK